MEDIIEQVKKRLAEDPSKRFFRAQTVENICAAYDQRIANLNKLNANRLAEIVRLRAALEWYAADDARLFEQGLVEHVDDRPATEALK